MMRKLAPPSAANLRIGEEAAEWLLRLGEAELPGSPSESDLEARTKAFRKWITGSPEHVRVFLETRETLHRMGAIGALRSLDVDALLADRQTQKHAEVIPLFGYAVRPRLRRSRGLWRIAAGLLVLVPCALLLWKSLQPSSVFVTGVGEQISRKLEDGSVIVLNTDSRVEVQYSGKERRIELLRGEALFQVEHDSTRPFTVRTGRTWIRAVGTQFNVHLRENTTDVAVVEGAVQVSELASPAVGQQVNSPSGQRTGAVEGLMRLAAGETAHVVDGQIHRDSGGAASKATLWRQRRLSFERASLAEVAAEFNRYNTMQIRVEGTAGDAVRLSGIFDADRPLALVRFAQKYDSLWVQQRGRDWVIGPR